MALSAFRFRMSAPLNVATHNLHQSGTSRRVSDGTRTRDRLDHNQELYQLSYAHQDATESSARG